MIEIEAHIPVPPVNNNPKKQRNCKYPWHSMQVGDSFFVADFTVSSFCSTAYSAGRRHGKKYTLRSMDGGVRVWRLA